MSRYCWTTAPYVSPPPAVPDRAAAVSGARAAPVPATTGRPARSSALGETISGFAWGMAGRSVPIIAQGRRTTGIGGQGRWTRGTGGEGERAPQPNHSARHGFKRKRAAREHHSGTLALPRTARAHALAQIHRPA